MENRYAAFDGGRRVRKWDAGSRLPEDSVNKEAAGYAVNNRRMLINLPVDDRYIGDQEETGLPSFEPVNPMTARRGFRGTYPLWEDPTMLLNVRSSRAGDDRLDEWGERFRAFSVNHPEPRHGAPPSYGYGRPTTSHHNVFGHNGVENLERDREALLRKLEELDYQINRSKEPEQRNRVPSDLYNARFRHHNGPVPFAGRYDMEVPDILGLPSNFQDPFGPEIAGTYSAYARNSLNRPFLKAQHMDYINPEPFESYPQDPFPPHRPSSRMIPEDLQVQLQHHISPARVRPSPDPSIYHSPDQSQPLERRSVNSDSDNSSGFILAQPKYGTTSNKSRKHWVAIAGGAPFVICSNCFNLLKLPRRLRIKENSTEKTRCGSCSAVIHLKLEQKRLIVYAIEDSADEAKSKGLREALNEGGNSRSLSPGLPDSGGMESQDDAEQNISWAKSEENGSSREQEVNVSRNDEIDHTSPNPPESPLGKNPQNSISMISHENLQNIEKSSDDGLKEEKVFPRTIDLPHSSSRSDPEATEVEVSASEYPITSMSQDSMDTIREEDQPKNKKAVAGSFFKGLLGRSVREQTRPEPIIENNRLKVTINGQPIPDDVVVQAEALAGPILPGDYWYDYHSGFWGVMRNPCLGIIPPFIKEFNYPLPTNCSSGDTGIFVNGRQLHHHDLKLLASRGLPTTRNQFYMIDVFGKVIDEDTGEQLCDLGKLAPTVVKNGRGFGMRVPKGMM